MLISIQKGLGMICLKNLFSQVIVMLYTKFQCLNMPGAGQKVCGGMVCGVVVWWVCKPVLVFSLVQAEQYESEGLDANSKWKGIPVKSDPCLWTSDV